MKPLSECSNAQLAQLRGVLTDIDDTLTSHGRLTSLAYCAMENIRNAGCLLIPITGRPAGWCDHIARMWPVDAIVGENGAFWFRYDTDHRQMQRTFIADQEARRRQRERLRAVAEQILREVPNARLAADQLYREADLAIDYCEDVERLSARDIERVVDIMLSHGLSAKVSSIHVNGWFGTHDKRSTTLEMLERSFAVDPVSARDTFAFVGDSPNDQPMFEYFSCTIGVANVRAFESQMATLPTYITSAPGGAGFAEFAAQLVRARRTS